MPKRDRLTSSNEADDDDSSLDTPEGNPLERDFSFARQRTTVLRPRVSDSAPVNISGSEEEPAGDDEESHPSQTFRQQRMAEYRDRQRAQKTSGGGASDES